MESAALRILLWDDDDCNDDAVWNSYMPAGAGSKVDDIWLFVSMALLDVILGHVCSTTSSTDF